MAHEHLHFKDDISVEHTHGKQVRVSLALLGTLAGGTLLLSHYVSKWFVYGPDAFQTEILAFAGAILFAFVSYLLGIGWVVAMVGGIVRHESGRYIERQC